MLFQQEEMAISSVVAIVITISLLQCCRVTVSMTGLSTQGNHCHFWKYHFSLDLGRAVLAQDVHRLILQPASVCIIFKIMQQVCCTDIHTSCHKLCIASQTGLLIHPVNILCWSPQLFSLKAMWNHKYPQCTSCYPLFQTLVFMEMLPTWYFRSTDGTCAAGHISKELPQKKRLLWDVLTCSKG